jgi:hypothetical protein
MPTTVSSPVTQHRRSPDAIRAAASGNRTREAVLATDARVRVYDWNTGRVIDEVLLVEGANWRDPAPLLLDHNRGIASMVGSVSGFRRGRGELLGVLRIAEGVQAADEVWRLISQGHLRSLSVGYSIDDAVEIPAGRTETVNGRSFIGPVRVVKRWTVRETSLVVIPADTAATIRSDTGANPMTHGNPLDIFPTIRAKRLPEILGAQMQQRGGLPENDRDVIRAALETEATLADLAGLVNTAVLTGFRIAPDTTTGWVRSVPLPNFLASQLAAVTTAPRLERLSRGRTAPRVGFAVTAEGWSLARFAASFEIDEQDMVAAPFDVFAVALEEIGAAARRLVPDLVYSTLLANGDMADGSAAFAAERGNCGNAALADTSLDAGIAAVGGQVLTDADGAPVHRGLAAKYLIVPPKLSGKGKRLVREMSTGDGDLIVRAESRIGGAGVVNPIDGSVIVASNTNWMLACPSDQAAGVVVGSLDGAIEPSVRVYPLGRGRWGVGVDVVFDLACRVLTPEALYWSTGAESAGE